MTSCYISWTPEQDARLRACLAEGLTRMEIAERLGVSTGSASGRIRRLGINLPPDILKERQRAGLKFGSAAAAAKRKANAPGCSARLAARPGRPTTPLPLAGRMTPQAQMRGCQTTHLLKTARKRQSIPIGPPPRKCQYPSGEKPFTFCHAPVVPGRPYCSEHTARCYVQVKPLKVVPAKPKEPFGDLEW